MSIVAVYFLVSPDDMQHALQRTARAREVPAGEHMRLGGAHELRMSGVQSLFGPTIIAARVPAPSAIVMETAGMVVAEEGHACCE
jgi:hypothetical protein